MIGKCFNYFIIKEISLYWCIFIDNALFLLVGLDPNNYATNQKFNYVRFIGCLGNIQFSHSGSPLSPIEVLMENQLLHGYVDQCTLKNPCLYNGKCINHYTDASCDCFGTGHEDKICFSSGI